MANVSNNRARAKRLWVEIIAAELLKYGVLFLSGFHGVNNGVHIAITGAIVSILCFALQIINFSELASLPRRKEVS